MGRPPSRMGSTAGPSDAEEEGEEEEEAEIPEELSDLPWPQQQAAIKNKAFGMMGIGTLLILIFSDPMVDVMSNVGTRIGVPPFYVAFVLAPLASNASELIASYSYAAPHVVVAVVVVVVAVVVAAVVVAAAAAAAVVVDHIVVTAPPRPHLAGTPPRSRPRRSRSRSRRSRAPRA